jgi:hypothetical protein
MKGINYPIVHPIEAIVSMTARPNTKHRTAIARQQNDTFVWPKIKVGCGQTAGLTVH